MVGGLILIVICMSRADGGGPMCRLVACIMAEGPCPADGDAEASGQVVDDFKMTEGLFERLAELGCCCTLRLNALRTTCCMCSSCG